MQSLFPAAPADVSDADLTELYAYPVERLWVRSNFVCCLDGSVQGPDGRSGSLSPRADQQLFTLLRSLCDVVLVGAGTVRAEGYQRVQPHEVDGRLRHRLGLAPLPAIAVVSHSGDLPPTMDHSDGGATFGVAVPDGASLRAAVERLAAQGYQRILCEGGPTLLRGLLAEGCVDDVCVTISPLLIAGNGRRMTHGPLLDIPVQLTLNHVLQHDGTLFCRYSRMRG